MIDIGYIEGLHRMDIAIFESDLVRYGVATWLDLIFDILNCCLFIGHVLLSSWSHGPVGTSQK
jgi:hypothetical protein